MPADPYMADGLRADAALASVKPIAMKRRPNDAVDTPPDLYPLSEEIMARVFVRPPCGCIRIAADWFPYWGPSYQEIHHFCHLVDESWKAKDEGAVYIDAISTNHWRPVTNRKFRGLASWPLAEMLSDFATEMRVGRKASIFVAEGVAAAQSNARLAGREIRGSGGAKRRRCPLCKRDVLVVDGRAECPFCAKAAV